MHLVLSDVGTMPLINELQVHFHVCAHVCFATDE